MKSGEQLSAVQPLREVVTARVVSGSGIRGATLSSTTTERGCDGECGERQQEVVKLGEQLSAVQHDGEHGEWRVMQGDRRTLEHTTLER